MKKKLFKWLFLFCSLIGISKFSLKQTGGFTVSHITNNFDPSFHIHSEQVIPKELLQQPFRYLGKGKQSYAFVSADGQYVLKLFNNRYQQKIAFYHFLEKCPFLNNWAQMQLTYFSYKLHKTFTSYLIAYQELKEETGLVAIHLLPTDSLQVDLTIIDKIGISHKLPSDQTAFLIQKKADLVYPTLLALKKQGDLKAAKEHLLSLLLLLQSKYKKGIFDNDPLIRTNFGFLKGQAIQIDVGPFSFEPAICDPSLYLPEILRITSSLKKWLEINYPVLLPFLEDQLSNMLESSHS
jgi:hypothetical protein